MKMVIIGNGPAAVAAVEAIRDVDRDCRIVMIAGEEGPCYSPCPLAEYVEGVVSRDSLFIRDDEFYRRLDIDTMFGLHAERVDAAASEVVLADGRREAYDRLLIAVGSKPFFPPISGLDGADGVFALKTMADADAIISRLDGARNAVVIGSGFIGLEAAQGLAVHGVSVSVLEVREQVLPQMLDADLAADVQAILENNAIRVTLDCNVEEIIGGDKITTVRADGRDIDCDLLVCAAGVRPDLAIVEGTGIRTGRGLVVDDNMETSIHNIYAAGDIIEADDIDGNPAVLPTWPNAVNSGRVAGYNMAGRPRRFMGLEAINVLRVFGVPLGSFGVSDGDKTIEWAGEGVRKRLTIADNRIVGMQVVGDVTNMGMYMEMMKKGVDVSAYEDRILSPGFGYGGIINTMAHKTAFTAAAQ